MKTKSVIRTKRATPEEAGKLLGVPWKRVQQLKKLVRENEEADRRGLPESKDQGEHDCDV